MGVEATGNMKFILQFVFKDGGRHDLPQKKLGDGNLIPLVGDKVVFDEDGSWDVLERYFNFDETPAQVTLMLGR
jgi:hypothetical protein